MNCNFQPTDYVHAVKPHLRYHRCTRAECGRGVFLSASQKAGRVACGHPSLGAGDAVAKIAEAIGIKKTPNCNCDKRQQLMNAVLPSLKKPNWLSRLQGAKKTLPPEWQITYDPIPMRLTLMIAKLFKKCEKKSLES